MGRPWNLDHDPEARPLGCNGKYGTSGYERHKKAGEPACEACSASKAHYMREYRRKGIRKKRPPQPCGEFGAVLRHYAKGEPLDFACKLANARHAQEVRDRAKAAKQGA